MPLGAFGDLPKAILLLRTVNIKKPRMNNKFKRGFYDILDTIDLSLYFDSKQRKVEEARQMPQTKTALAGLMVICLTLITLTWLLQGTLCELQAQGGDVLTLALKLAYESR